MTLKMFRTADLMNAMAPSIIQQGEESLKEMRRTHATLNEALREFETTPHKGATHIIWVRDKLTAIGIAYDAKGQPVFSAEPLHKATRMEPVMALTGAIWMNQHKPPEHLCGEDFGVALRTMIKVVDGYIATCQKLLQESRKGFDLPPSGGA